MRVAFIKCSDGCKCETQKCIISGYKQCPVCLNVLKSQCSKSSCIVGGKKPIMISALPATKSAKALLKEMMNDDFENEDEDSESDVNDVDSGEESDNLDEYQQEESDYDDKNDAGDDLKVGDFIKITKDPFIGFYAVITEKSYGDEWELQYCEMKFGKWVLKDLDYDSREVSDMIKVDAKVDGRGRYTFNK